MCRDEGTTRLLRGALALRERARYLKQVSRRKEAPVELKRMVERLQKARKTDISNEYREFRRIHKNILLAHKRLCTRRQLARRRVCQLERLLGLFHSYDFPLPPLAVAP